MDSYFLRHLLDHHRPQSLDAKFKKILLAAHNHFAGAQNRALALRDIAHQLHCGAKTLLHIVFDLAVSAFGDQHLAIAPAEPQAGQVFLVH